MTIYTVVIVNTHLYLEKLFSETANAGPSPNAWGVCIFCIIVVCSSTETWMPFQILMRFHSEHRLSKYKNEKRLGLEGLKVSKGEKKPA